eukprot:Platyproteum_vivax@DN11630_c0_g1_i1.p1
MRCQSMPEKADIMVSELLGSFGDNELSPECLDGAQNILKSNGISIPAFYKSSIQPIQSLKLWTGIRDFSEDVKWSRAYIAQLHSVFYVSEEGPTDCFEFFHPNWNFTNQWGNDTAVDGQAPSNKHNTRYA